jgi:hypothetical protein
MVYQNHIRRRGFLALTLLLPVLSHSLDCLTWSPCFKGIGSWNKMEFWHCIDRNFLIIRWGIKNFKFMFSILKFKKCKFCRFVHFGVQYFSLKSTGTVRKLFPRNVKFFPHTGNPPTAYKHLSSKSSRMVRNRRAGPKTLVYTRVAILGDFSPKKLIWGFFWKMFCAFLDQYKDF